MEVADQEEVVDYLALEAEVDYLALDCLDMDCLAELDILVVQAAAAVVAVVMVHLEGVANFLMFFFWRTMTSLEFEAWLFCDISNFT